MLPHKLHPSVNVLNPLTGSRIICALAHSSLACTVQPAILRMIGAWQQPMDPGFQTESVGASALVVPENFAPQHDLESQKDPAWRQELESIAWPNASQMALVGFQRTVGNPPTTSKPRREFQDLSWSPGAIEPFNWFRGSQTGQAARH
ncbi:hypothetical protein DFH08DRAFT_941694 [Mycena albidolilacea]|uniref:Uncharacterized protein n=1 Tax=Mycena albidolilacea TaxID=1033008 RepID=A0AAD6ZID3_9AGAR|nr:hypothetical protein DFH08DRAFT_941694 [Mycena albidolilacea]